MERKAILIEVIEQCISEPMFFDTWKEAEHEMLERFKNVMGLTDEDLENAEESDTVEGLRLIDEDTWFKESQARCERYGNNYDWRIFEVQA